MKRTSIIALCLPACLWMPIAAVCDQPQAAEQSKTVTELASAVERRFDNYDELEFAYHVLTHATPSPEATPELTSTLITDGVIDSTDVFKILRFHQSARRRHAASAKQLDPPNGPR
jgi:hypothetical protein